MQSDLYADDASSGKDNHTLTIKEQSTVYSCIQDRCELTNYFRQKIFLR